MDRKRASFRFFRSNGMRTLFKTLVLTLLVSSVFASSVQAGLGLFPTHNSHLNPRLGKVSYDDHTKAYLPATQPLPRGWIVVGHRHTMHQYGGTCYQFIIQKIPTTTGTYITICKSQEIPCGFAIDAEVHSYHCPGFGKNAYRIVKL